MSGSIKINLPKLGESIVSATVVQWFKQVGDSVELDEPLLEVSTDKINSEIPSPAAGVIQEILAVPGQELQVGEALAILSTTGPSSAPSVSPGSTEVKPSCSSEMEDFLSPSVMRLLKEKGLGLGDIDRIPRTGQGGRLTKKDIEAYQAPKVSSVSSSSVPDTERVQMSPMRKAIAENMTRSFYEAPHASLATEVDVTLILKTIQEHKASFLEKYGTKLTITAFVARAIARALHKFPLINASLEGDTIVMKRFVNLGVAVSVDQGVMVPVIRGCQLLSLPEIAKEIGIVAEKARTQRLQVADTQDGTITMTNFGMTGTMIGIPIIRYPEVAIVGLGAITRKVVPMPDDSIAVRSILWVSLTFDHRVLDGIYGCGFLNELKQQLEQNAALD